MPLKREISSKPTPLAFVPKRNIAALMFVVIYAYPLLNSFLSIKGVLGFYLDIFFFAVMPAACFYIFCRIDPVFRLMLIDSLKKCSLKNLVALLLCGMSFAYLVIYAPKYFNGNDGSVGDVVSFVLQKCGLLGVFYLALSAGVIEEFLYKALLNYAIPWTVSNLTFAIVSGAIFGVAHLEQGTVSALILTLFLGVPTAYYYRISNNLLGLMIMHFSVDIMLFGRLWAWLYA